MTSGQGMLVSYQDRDWLVTDTGRHAIDLSDRAVTSAVGIPVTAKATPISEGLFNALPNSGPWILPQVPAGGAPNTLGLPANLVIGTVFQTVTESGEQQYVVLPDGVAKVNETTAAALRASNSYGLISPPSVESSIVAKIPEQVVHLTAARHAPRRAAPRGRARRCAGRGSGNRVTNPRGPR